MKTITSTQDLAINGASPAFNEPLHVGYPNLGNREAFLKYADDIFERKRLSNNGPLVQELEQRIAEHHQVKHCVAICNGTVALEIAIRALELEKEVIVPSYTFIATAHALHWQGIKPVFADISSNTHNIDPESVSKLITPDTTGIIGVHLWGRPAPVDELQSLADEKGLKLMFDSAHAFGCSHNGVMIGNFGQCEVLSFHATKFFNTFEGGAILTNDDSLAGKFRLMRNFGFSDLDDVTHPGTNGKMIEVAGAMGLVNLNSLPEIIEKNRENYFEYIAQLNDIPGVSLQYYNESEKNNYQYIVVELQDDCMCSRDEIIHALREENILARRYFWPGCHNMLPYRTIDPHVGNHLPNTKKIADNVIVLPTGTAIGKYEINTIASIIRVLIASQH